MPYAENGTRDGGERIGSEMQYSQGRGKSRVLHTHLNAQCHALGLLQMQQATHGKANAKPQQVMNHYNNYH